MKLSPAAGPLEIMAIALLGPLLEANKGYKYFTVITDRFTKFTRANPLKRTAPTVLAEAFLNHWAFPYGLLLYLLTDNGTNLSSKLFESVCTVLYLKP